MTHPVIAASQGWLEKDGGYIGYLRLPNSYETEDCFFSQKDLASIHPDLPDLLRHFRHIECTNGFSNVVSGKYIRYTLDEWTDSHVVLIDKKGRDRLLRQAYTLNYNLKPDGSGPRVMHLEAECLETDIWQHRGVEKGVVIRSVRMTIVVPTSELDNAYPAWRQRLQVANGLSLEPRELAQFVLAAPKLLPTVDISDMTFD